MQSFFVGREPLAMRRNGPPCFASCRVKTERRNGYGLILFYKAVMYMLKGELGFT